MPVALLFCGVLCSTLSSNQDPFPEMGKPSAVLTPAENTYYILGGPLQYASVKKDDDETSRRLLAKFAPILKYPLDDIESGMIQWLEYSTDLMERRNLMYSMDLLDEILFDVPSNRCIYVRMQGKRLTIRQFGPRQSGPPLAPVSKFRAFRKIYKRRALTWLSVRES